MRSRLIGFSVLTGVLMTPAPTAAAGPDLKQVEKQFGPPVLWVPKPSVPPAIDGKLDDPCWNDARPVPLGFSTGAWWDTPSQKTEARVLADDKAVYFAVRCSEAEPDRVVPGGAPRKGMVVGADAVEFFLDPGCRGQRYEYFHVIVTPDGRVYQGRGLALDGGKASVTAKVGRFDGGWAVEAAVPLADLVPGDAAVPKVWGLNVCRQRPELGCDMPKAARAAGNRRFDPPMWKLDDPAKYRPAEYTCWSPTMADFCGWPFYSDSRPFHLAQRFGHAVLEVGTRDVAPPPRKFEVLFRSDFDDGTAGPFGNAGIGRENFRGPGCSLGFSSDRNMIRFTRPLKDLDDVTLLMAFRLRPRTLPPQYLRVVGRSPDGVGCGPERYEFFLTPEEAEARDKFLDEYHRKRFGAGPFALYDTHADMVQWKPCGRVRRGPGPWAMVEGYFSEPTPGQVRWPGKDWVILRLRLALFRREPGPKQGQQLVPLAQGYPDGLTLVASPKEGARFDDVVIFRGVDDEPPARVTGVRVRRAEGGLELSWERAKDNTLTAFYRVYAGEKMVAETHRLAARLKASAVEGAPLRVVAVDLYGNASDPSEPAAR
jgi:hypothetical protein